MALKFTQKNNTLALVENGEKLLIIPIRRSIVKISIRKHDRGRRTWATNPSEARPTYYAENIKWGLAKKILKCKAESIPLQLNYYGKYKSKELPIVFQHEVKKDFGFLKVEITLSIELKGWQQGASISDFLKSYKIAMDDLGYDSRYILDLEHWPHEDPFFIYSFEIKTGTLRKRIEESITIAKETYQKLIVKTKNGLLLTNLITGGEKNDVDFKRELTLGVQKHLLIHKPPS